MAERIKAEKRILHNRILHNEMCRKLEVVREHYRNKVIESGSRGGVMVRMAMEAKSDDPPLCHAHNYTP